MDLQVEYIIVYYSTIILSHFPAYRSPSFKQCVGNVRSAQSEHAPGEPWCHVRKGCHVLTPHPTSSDVIRRRRAAPRISGEKLYKSVLHPPKPTARVRLQPHRSPRCESSVRLTCLWKVSSRAFVSSQRHMSSPDMSSASVCAPMCLRDNLSISSIAIFFSWMWDIILLALGIIAAPNVQSQTMRYTEACADSLRR